MPSFIHTSSQPEQYCVAHWKKNIKYIRVVQSVSPTVFMSTYDIHLARTHTHAYTHTNTWSLASIQLAVETNWIYWFCISLYFKLFFLLLLLPLLAILLHVLHLVLASTSMTIPWTCSQVLCVRVWERECVCDTNAYELMVLQILNYHLTYDKWLRQCSPFPPSPPHTETHTPTHTHTSAGAGDRQANNKWKINNYTSQTDGQKTIKSSNNRKFKIKEKFNSLQNIWKISWKFNSKHTKIKPFHGKCVQFDGGRVGKYEMKNQSWKKKKNRQPNRFSVGTDRAEQK